MRIKESKIYKKFHNTKWISIEQLKKYLSKKKYDYKIYIGKYSIILSFNEETEMKIYFFFIEPYKGIYPWNKKYKYILD